MKGRPDSEARDRRKFLPPPDFMGERSAVGTKSGESVRQSDPGLRRPTPPSTAGRKPAARPPIQFLPAENSKVDSRARAAGLSQRKTGRSARRSLAIQARREAPGSFTPSDESDSPTPYALDESQISALIQFFSTLDRWDKEAHGSQIM